MGCVSQGFSLYTELTVRQNLILHAQLLAFPATGTPKFGFGIVDRPGWSAPIDNYNEQNQRRM
jgi:ribosome-dependent ATPase